MDEAASSAASGADNGLIGRLRQRGADLGKGRRLVISLPGWSDLGDGRGLWARCTPYNRRLTMAWGMTPNDVAEEHQEAAQAIAEACEEILIGTAAKRTPLADEPDIINGEGRSPAAGPLRFGEELGQLLRIGGSDAPSVVKRMLIHGDDDAGLYGVHGELIAWSSNVENESLEVAAGE